MELGAAIHGAKDVRSANIVPAAWRILRAFRIAGDRKAWG
jgi:hypothetical protein